MFEGWPPPVLDPAGPYATSVSLLSWVLFAMGAAVLLVVLAALYVRELGLLWIRAAREKRDADEKGNQEDRQAPAGVALKNFH